MTTGPRALLVAFVGTLLVLGVGVGVDLSAPPRYRATATVLALPAPDGGTSERVAYQTLFRGGTAAGYAQDVADAVGAAGADTPGSAECDLSSSRAPRTSAITVTADCADPAAAVAAVDTIVRAAVDAPTRGPTVLVRPADAPTAVSPLGEGLGARAALGALVLVLAVGAGAGAMTFARAARARPLGRSR